MRVCMFTRAVLEQGKGGMEDHIEMLVRGLSGQGIKITVLTTSHPSGKEYEKKGGAEYYYLPGSKPKKYSFEWWGNATRKFLELHSKEPFDLVHSQSAGGYYFAKQNLGKKLGVPMVTSLHGTTYDELVTQFNKIKGIPAIRSLGDVYDTLRVIPKAAYMLWGYFFVDSKYLSSSDIIIATSNEQKKTLMSVFGVHEPKIEIVFNAIDESLFSPSPRYLAVKEIDILGTPVFLCVARLEREKGVQNAILALKALLPDYPTALLVIVGDGTYRKSLETLCKDLNVHRNVKFTGFVEFPRLPYYFNACDIFLNPTIRQDGYDLTVLEAMSCQKPVIASNIGSMPTAISHGVDGIMVRPGSVQDLSFAIENLLKNPSKSKEISENARKKILENFSAKSMVQKTIGAYKIAVARAKGK